jgi:hypothetical protein
MDNFVIIGILGMASGMIATSAVVSHLVAKRLVELDKEIQLKALIKSLNLDRPIISSPFRPGSGPSEIHQKLMSLQ